jgi:pilus assembly protein CpaB
MLLARHRPVLAAGAAAVAVLAALPVLAPGAGATVPVLTAAHDLAWGAPLQADDVVVARVPASAVPDGALTSAEGARGRLLTSPVRRGEPITDVRLVGPALLSEPGLVAVGVRIADAGVAALLQAGSVVDVLVAAADDGFEHPVGPGTAEVVAGRVRVLAVPGGKRATFAGTLDGALVLVAATEAQAARLAAAGATGRLSVALRPDSVSAP